MQLNQALKEWAVTVEALLAGKTVVLMRKGGIREAQEQFSVISHRVLLMPTYEHQRPELLKPAFASVPQPVEADKEITLEGWAEITHVAILQNPSMVTELQPWHIWNSAFVNQRLQWKPQRPLQILLLRSHRLPQPVKIPQRPEYRGCRSWIQLANPVDISDSQPVLAQAHYIDQTARILEAIGEKNMILSDFSA